MKSYPIIIIIIQWKAESSTHIYATIDAYSNFAVVVLALSESHELILLEENKKKSTSRENASWAGLFFPRRPEKVVNCPRDPHI